MGCRHQQAEPVVLITGETVACVCIRCLERLSAEYIDQQYDRAYQIATCPHNDTVDVAAYGGFPRTVWCAECGERTPFLWQLADAMIETIKNPDAASKVAPIDITPYRRTGWWIS